MQFVDELQQWSEKSMICTVCRRVLMIRTSWHRHSFRVGMQDWNRYQVRYIK